MHTIMADVRYGLRLLRRSPGFTIAATLTLAVGIGATSAIFSVVDGVMLRPLPYERPERIVQIVTIERDGDTATNHAPANYLDLARDAHAFAAIGAYRQSLLDLIRPGRGALRLVSAEVTPAFFDVFGVPAHAGRPLGRTDRPGDGLAVVSESAWRTTLGADPALVGRTLDVGGETYEVAGIMPARFAWPNDRTQIWTLAPHPVPRPPMVSQDEWLEQRGIEYFSVVGRLRDGWSLARA